MHTVEAHTGVAWTELELEDERVGEIMVQVNTLYREAELKLEQDDWGKSREVNVRKRKIQQGIDPDIELKQKQKARRNCRSRRKDVLKRRSMPRNLLLLKYFIGFQYVINFDVFQKNAWLHPKSCSD